MKVGTDGVLLGAWFDMPRGASVLDVGAGCGLIGLMAAQRGASRVVEVELDGEAAAEATYNVEASPWSDCISVVHIDFLAYHPAMKFDRIVSNPPFFTEAVLSPDMARAAARHESSLPLEALLVKASSMMTDNGRLALIVPMSRFDDLIYAASLARLQPVRICRVTTGGKGNKPPTRLLAEFGFEVCRVESTSLSMQSDAYRRLTGEFYLDRMTNK